MKRITALLIMLFAVVLFAFADTQLGRTENNLSDSSFVVQAYYKGVQNTSITLAFKDYSGQSFTHDSQSTQGTSVNASTSHLGANTSTIFTWTMTGSTNNTVSLTFTFSTLQAELNGMFYRPTYTLSMTVNTTKRSGYSTTLTDTFDDNTAAQVVTGIKATQDSEFSEAGTVSYSGKTNKNNSYKWERSGTCTLNISDYEQGIPGSYEYRCWVVTEFTTT